MKARGSNCSPGRPQAERSRLCSNENCLCKEVELSRKQTQNSQKAFNLR